ncbi:hypothetical protein [Streptomyces sp. NBC_01718]|uniref:hypothetical protein n=1 Tax=Streptomyces sp. NBC_01718 TaxID=2975919 RepID=UPI00352E2E1D
MRPWLPELRSQIGNAARCEQHSDEEEKPEAARLREHMQAPQPVRHEAVVYPVGVVLIHF